MAVEAGPHVEHAVAPAHHHPGMWVFPRPEVMTQDVISKTFTMPGSLALAMLAAGALFVLGIIGFILRVVADGFAPHGPWGYYAATFSFVFMITGTAPLVAVGLRITKNHWRRPMSRVSELFAVTGVLNILMFIPLIFVLPAMANPQVTGEELAVRRSIWFGVPIGAPLWWDTLGVVFLAITALAILWLSSMPDMAQARSSSSGWRYSLYGALAGRWHGTKRQWTMHKAGLALLGALYFIFLIFVHFLIVSDYAMSLVPGYKDAILPPLYSITGLQAALGLVLVVLFILKRWGGYREYIGVSPFWSASKILLALSLLWGYHVFAFLITYWYGRLVVEQNVLAYFMFGSYGGLFAANVAFTFLLPFAILLWNPLRRTDWGPALAGLMAIIGALLFNVRLFAGAFNAGHIYDVALEVVPPAVGPDIWDIFIILGGLGGVALLFLLATRLLPVMSLWEMKEGIRYQRMQNLGRGEYLVLAKPE